MKTLTLSLSILLTLTCSRPTARAAVRRVCLQGCDYNSANSAGRPLRAAVLAAQPGDIIEVEAGQTFTDQLLLPYKEGDRPIIIRSSRWQELPPAGQRIDPERHAPLLATVRALVPEHVVFAGAFRYPTTAIDLDTDQLYFENSVANINAVACSSSAYVLPDGIQRFQKYYLKRSSPTVAQLSLTPNGPAIDIRDRGQGVISCTEWDTGHHYTFSGLRFTLAPGANLNSYPLVTIGTGDESSPNAAPHHISFDHCVLTGNPNESTPRSGIVANGTSLSITDSWIGHIKQFFGESKAIVLWSGHDIEIRNNYLSSASLGILVGGAGNGTGLVSSGITISGNHIQKIGGYFYKQGDGPPQGACYYRGGSGTFYRDRTPSPNTCANGACYECQPNGTWAPSPNAVYRSENFQTKSGLELKHCDRCVLEGNVIEGAFAGPDGGNVYCMNVTQVVQGGAFHYNSRLRVENNLCRDTWSGLTISGTGEAALQRPMSNNVFRNNLFLGLAGYPALSMWPNPTDVHVRPLTFSTGQRGLIVDHNTFRYSPSATYQAQSGLLMIGGPPQFGLTANSRITNNFLPAGLYGWLLDAAPAAGCAGMNAFVEAGSSPTFRANVFYSSANPVGFGNCPQSQQIYSVASESAAGFTGPDTGQLMPSSPFSAHCTSSCLTAGTDGTDVGVDMVELQAAISGAESGQESWRRRAGIEVTAGSDKAVVSFRRLSNACQVQVFFDASRRTPVADTPQPASDARPGSVGEGALRQFVLGLDAPLEADTLYHGLLTCDTQVVPFQFATSEAGTADMTVNIDLTDTVAGQAAVLTADNAEMAGAAAGVVTFEGGQARLIFTVPPNGIRYVRWQKRTSDGAVLAQSPIRVYVNR